MIWLLAYPPPSPVSKLDPRHTGRLRKRNNLLKGEDGRGCARSQIIRRLESLVYKSFNTFRAAIKIRRGHCIVFELYRFFRLEIGHSSYLALEDIPRFDQHIKNIRASLEILLLKLNLRAWGNIEIFQVTKGCCMIKN